MYGLRIPASESTPQRSCIGEIHTTSAGNIVLRVGREYEPGTWRQTEHVVLTRGEAVELADVLSALATNQ